MSEQPEIKVNDVVRYIGKEERGIPAGCTGEVVRAFPDLADTNDPLTHLVWFDGFEMDDLVNLWFNPRDLEVVSAAKPIHDGSGEIGS